MANNLAVFLKMEAFYVLSQVLCEPPSRELKAIGPEGPGRFRSAGVSLRCFFSVAQPRDAYGLHSKTSLRPI